MNNKNLKITVIVIGVFLFVVVAITILILSMFKAQYNSKGISHFLVITIDMDQPKEYLGSLDECRVYIDRLSIEGTNFRTADAKNLSIKEAIEKNLTSLDEWKEYAWNTRKSSDTEILLFENYEIAVNEKECIIRPKSKAY